MKIKDTVHFQWYRHAFVLIVIALCFAGSATATNASLTQFITNSDQILAFLKKLANPEFSYLPKLAGPMLKTLKMSALGTMLGLFFAVPLSFLATTVATKNRSLTNIIRFILNVIRTIPNLLLAAILVAVVGIGEATGVLTIAIFTLGMLSQLLYETIETIDYAPIEAAESVGANKIQIAVWSIWPQIINNVASYFFYAFELNVRASTVLGYVGAGGIGVTLSSALGLFRYDRVSIIIICIFLVVLIVDTISEAIRRRLA
jgi:phosphonate transport system permease protein